MKIKTLVAWLSSAFLLSASSLKIGDDLPVLEGKNQEGNLVKIASKKGDQWLLVFTYPMALTPG